MKDYLRWRSINLKEALKTRRVVIISGARQTGKTTLAKETRNKNSVFMPLDQKNVLAAALNDPAGFVKNKVGTMIIDEVHKAPELISEIKLFIQALIVNKTMDYTEWRQNNLFKGMSIESISREAMALHNEQSSSHA